VTKLGLKNFIDRQSRVPNGRSIRKTTARCAKQETPRRDRPSRFPLQRSKTFDHVTGHAEKRINDEAAGGNCTRCWKRVLPYAEENNVGIVLEHSTAATIHNPMKGHPGYWGDDVISLRRC